MESSLLRSRAGPPKLLPETILPHPFFSHPADTQYLILPSQLVIFFGIRVKTQVSTSTMGAISDLFSLTTGLGSMEVHSQCQYFLSDESFLSSVMHFLFRFDSSFCRDSSADCEVVRFSLPLPLLPYVQAFFPPFFIIHYTMNILNWDCCAHVLYGCPFALLPMLLFFGLS